MTWLSKSSGRWVGNYPRARSEVVEVVEVMDQATGCARFSRPWRKETEVVCHTSRYSRVRWKETEGVEIVCHTSRYSHTRQEETAVVGLVGQASRYSRARRWNHQLVMGSMLRVVELKRRKERINGRTFANVPHLSAHFTAGLAFVQVIAILEVVSLGLKIRCGVGTSVRNLRLRGYLHRRNNRHAAYRPCGILAGNATE